MKPKILGYCSSVTIRTCSQLLKCSSLLFLASFLFMARGDYLLSGELSGLLYRCFIVVTFYAVLQVVSTEDLLISCQLTILPITGIPVLLNFYQKAKKMWLFEATSYARNDFKRKLGIYFSHLCTTFRICGITICNHYLFHSFCYISLLKHKANK